MLDKLDAALRFQLEALKRAQRQEDFSRQHRQRGCRDQARDIDFQ